jgi:SAM-dependent methyltransferase
MRRTYGTLYRLGIVPWDRADVPAPLKAAVDELVPGTAVNLGCGTGRQARYLADRGWAVTAVDYVPRAVALARRHDPESCVTWRVADVTDVATVDPGRRLRGGVLLLLDNGCAHGLAPVDRPAWAATVTVLAGPEAVLLVRAQPPGGGPRGAWAAIGPAGVSAADIIGAGRLGLPAGAYTVIGVLEVAAALGLGVGLAFVPLGIAAAGGLALLMAGAVVAHVRAGDPFASAVPALLVGLGAAVALALRLMTA